MTKKLLVFDLNGVLISKVRKRSARENLSLQHDEDVGCDFITLEGNVIFIRNGVVDVLTELSKEYYIAIWSSTTLKNVNKIISTVFKNIEFLFIWDRSTTLLDPEYDKYPHDEHSTVKNLNHLLSNPFNWKREFTIYNVVLVDDELDKLRFNDDKNIIIIPKFDICDKRSYSFPLSFLNEVESKFLNLH